MSRARHRMEHEDHREEHERGGQVKTLPYNAQGSEAEKEADEKKHGGKVERKRRKHGGVADGESTHHRLDRPHRRRGGKVGEVGANTHPLSSASKVKPAEGHADTMSGDAGDVKDLEPD